MWMLNQSSATAFASAAIHKVNSTTSSVGLTVGVGGPSTETATAPKNGTLACWNTGEISGPLLSQSEALALPARTVRTSKQAKGRLKGIFTAVVPGILGYLALI